MSKVSDYRKKIDAAPPEPPGKEPPPQGNIPYDPREFYVPSTTKNKQPPVQMFFKAQQGEAHEVARIVWSRQFPYYQTPSDLLRHATHRHIVWLHTLGAPATAEWLQTEAIVELMREEDRQQKFEGYMINLQTTVDKSVQMGMRSEARLLVYKIKLLIAQMSEGRWKERWQQQLKEQFGFLDESGAEGNGGKG